jgi:hypothetical protein
MAEECGLDSFGSRQGPVVGSFEHGNEPYSSIKQDISQPDGPVASQE